MAFNIPNNDPGFVSNRPKVATQKQPDWLKRNFDNPWDILVKPVFTGGKPGGFLTDSPGTYTVYDKDGNTIDEGSTSGRGSQGYKGQSDAIANGLGYSYDFTPEGGETGTYTLTPGQRQHFDYGKADATQTGGSGSSGSGGGGGTFPNGGVIPSAVDFSQIAAPFVDFPGAFSFAQGVGHQNAQTYYDNITSQENRDAALGLIDTDVTGITNAADKLAPYNRIQGAQDTAENMSRAGAIDKFNVSRIPGFNTFNRGETATNNQFNRDERKKSIAQSGLDYRDRITALLDELDTQSTGVFGNKLLNGLMTSTARDRGADIGSAAGISPGSTAGINIQDKIDVDKRIALAMDAQHQIPGVLNSAQQILQPPEEQNPTLRGVPVTVPLNTSNVADRLPVTANISAGQTQLGIGTAQTNYEVIPATTALQANLNTQEYNATGLYNRDMAVANATQSQMQARDSAQQADINQGRTDAAANAGIQQRENSANMQAGTSLLGTVAGVVSDFLPQILGNNDSGGSGGSPGYGVPTADNPYGNTLGPDPGPGGYLGGTDSMAPVSSGGVGGSGTILEDPGMSGPGPSSGGLTIPDSFGQGDSLSRMSSPFKSASQDMAVLGSATSTLANWSQMTPAQQMNNVGQMAVQVLADKGVVTSQQAHGLQVIGNAITTMVNPVASTGQRASAIGSVMTGGAAAGGIIDAQTGANTLAGLQALSVLTNPQASDTDKLAALSGIGIQSGVANGIIDKVNGGDTLAALSIFNTTRNWDKMTPLQQASSVLNTSHSVFNAMSAEMSSSAANTSASYFADAAATDLTASIGSYLTGAAGVASIAVGVDQAADVIDANASLPRDKAVPQGLAGGAMSGAAIGAGVGIIGGMTAGATAGSAVPVPIVGTVVGAAVGAIAGYLIGNTSSGKRSPQMARDSWRNAMENSGLASKNKDGYHEVSLADGSKYNIGVDGTNKFKNKDGGERFTYDVDWSNPLSAQSIPDAHLFAIASGLNPTDNDKYSLWHKAVGQTVNASTSNVNDVSGARNNIKAMMQNVDPRQLAMQTEILRTTDKISDQEYGVYLDRINKMYGTKLVPTDRQKSKDFFINTFNSYGDKISKQDKSVYEYLLDPGKQKKGQRDLQERISEDELNAAA